MADTVHKKDVLEKIEWTMAVPDSACKLCRGCGCVYLAIDSTENGASDLLHDNNNGDKLLTDLAFFIEW